MEKDQANVYTSHITNTTSTSSLPKRQTIRARANPAYSEVF